MRRLTEQEFVWDDRKARANERKHGVSFELAITVFRDPLSTVFHNVGHEDSEDRWTVIGSARNGILLWVVYALSESSAGSCVRMISARRATLHERREYETGEYSIREPTMTGEYEAQAQSDVDDEAEVDFSKPIRGVFANVSFPIFIDNSTLGYFHRREIATGTPAEEMINEVLRQHVAAAGYVPPVFGERRE